MDDVRPLTDRISEAKAYLRRALEVHSDLVGALQHLASATDDQGRADCLRGARVFAAVLTTTLRGVEANLADE